MNDQNVLTPAKEPVSARGRRKRARLMDAAKTIFQRDGFAESRITDIVNEASASTGSFYTYFDNKEQILKAVLTEAQQDMLHTSLLRGHPDATSSPKEIVDYGIRRYIEYYAQNTALMLLMEQVAGIDPDFREERRQREHDIVESNAELLGNWQSTGQARTTMDAYLVTRALSSMTIKFAYNCLAMRENEDVSVVVDTLTQVWLKTLEID
ncbi:MAG TPA: TetR/AcrR family transcriptional regulator [Candidatus Corynebacterium avicola]|uniref:TetR/AcrR family transcriptional regulator n=1 Tax=Candidatus Corynebacterium avicola TaxID=2838527 RepID=A0A9D1RQC7_9CORY|nr:TetR/AcrR family transcriptional regulator [Candidatus Corynebacterium avicola]